MERDRYAELFGRFVHRPDASVVDRDVVVRREHLQPAEPEFPDSTMKSRGLFLATGRIGAVETDEPIGMALAETRDVIRHRGVVAINRDVREAHDECSIDARLVHVPEQIVLFDAPPIRCPRLAGHPGVLAAGKVGELCEVDLGESGREVPTELAHVNVGVEEQPNLLSSELRGVGFEPRSRGSLGSAPMFLGRLGGRLRRPRARPTSGARL